MFNKTRLTVARHRALLTKKQLAEAIDVEPRAVSGFEAGEYLPSEDNIERIARRLGFPLAFFFADDIDIPTPEGVSFRSMEKMTSKQRDAAISAGALAYLLIDWIEREFDLPDPDLPDYRDDDPEVAAVSLRLHWKLGELPISNMIHLLEAKGVRVFSLVENCVEVDAYSVWRGKRPCVFLNTGKSAERRRFDAAHELAHLVLHKGAAPSGVEAEKQADAFASAFLMPQASMKAIERVRTLNELLPIKQKWGVSVAALTVRLRRLGLISDWNYQTFFREMSMRGWRKKEPTPMRPESSQIWQKVFAQLRSEGTGVQALAGALHVPVEELAKLVFGLVTVPIAQGSPLRTPPSGSAHLRLVKG